MSSSHKKWREVVILMAVVVIAMMAMIAVSVEEYSGNSGNSRNKSCASLPLYCRDCRTYLCLTDEECTRPDLSSIFISSPQHRACLQCETNMICNLIGVCDSCVKNHPYHFITEDVAVGNMFADYSPFDVIVNLNFPSNRASLHEVIYEDRNEKRIIQGGIEDQLDDFTTSVLDRIAHLINEKKEKNKILFHCYMGMSRSATAAIYYIAGVTGNTTQSVYEMAKSKRKMISPHNGFKALLKII